MSLDKTLFKALRAGGLGHKAALLLADKSSKYALGPALDVVNGPWQQVIVKVNGDEVLKAKFRREDRAVILGGDISWITPLPANSVVEIWHWAYAGGGAEDDYPNLSPMVLGIVKLADANGIPVTADEKDFVGYRTDGVVTKPTAQAGFATANLTDPDASYGYKVTVTAAGWYRIIAVIGVPV